jgi:diguanylate cyclase (GGDEF)-like protein/PAS domain S-box-containing protein
MIHSKKKWYGKIDSFWLLLLFFAVILYALFFYLQGIDNNIKHYDNYRQQLQKMGMLNHKIEMVFYQKYRYVDHDEVSFILKEFEISITKLKRSQMKKEFGEHIYKDFLTIEKDYHNKEYLLQKFEALNSRLTNSIHTIFDLRKTIENDLALGNVKQEEIHNVFFLISRILMDMPYKREQFDKHLSKLKEYQSENELFRYLYVHMQHFIKNIDEMRILLKENEKVDLMHEIMHVMNDLSHYYNKVRNEQKLIALGFFLIAFIILVLLMFNYRKERRKQRELLAFKSAIENSDNAIVITDTDRHIKFVNDAFEVHTGYSKEEVYGENPNILKSDLVPEEVYKELNETLDRGEKWRGELINRRKDGSLLYEQASIVPIFMDGELVQYLAIKLDVTEYIRQQKILQQSATVYNSIEDGILITDKEKKIISVNPAFSNIFGYSKEELLGKEPMVIMSLKKNDIYYKNMWHRLLTTGRWSGRVDNMAKNGKIIPVWLTIAVVKDKKEEIQNFIAIYTNLEEIIKMEEKANFLAYHDSLTKLPNRTQFERQIVDILELAKAEKEKVAILFIDLDRFKVINDTLGHHIGDEMLIQLAQRIKAQLDGGALLARIGGDEFVVVMNLKENKKDAGILADKLLAIIREPILIHDYHLNTTASIGIAVYPDDGEDRNEIVKHADSAMYHAKEKGKDTYQFYTRQLSLDVQARLDLEQELLHALQKKELTLYYQPQYDLNTRKVVGAETLLRWKNEHLGLVPPDKFISIAEETGIIIDIGYFLFEEACKEYMHWMELGLDIESISINISSIQFREDDIFQKFQNIILRTGIPAHKIEIEITERFIMEYSTTNMTILEDLRNIGCKISIDDFGTGYSSMSYIKRLALDTIKIDKSFVTDLPYDSHDAEVSKAIIALSKSLGYQVVAEGIETKEQEIFLREYGCNIGQGFYFGKPMASEDFIRFMKER